MKIAALLVTMVLPMIASASPSFVDMGTEISAIFNDQEITDRVLGTIVSIEFVEELPQRTDRYRLTTSESRPVKDPAGVIIQYANEPCVVLVEVSYAGFNGPRVTKRDFKDCPNESKP